MCRVAVGARGVFHASVTERIEPGAVTLSPGVNIISYVSSSSCGSTFTSTTIYTTFTPKDWRNTAHKDTYINRHETGSDSSKIHYVGIKGKHANDSDSPSHAGPHSLDDTLNTFNTETSFWPPVPPRFVRIWQRTETFSMFRTCTVVEVTHMCGTTYDGITLISEGDAICQYVDCDHSLKMGMHILLLHTSLFVSVILHLSYSCIC